MSLINDALKKAQRQRHAEQVAAAAGEPSGGPVAKRGRPMSVQLLILIAASAAVLIVLSAVITVYFFNREPPPLPHAAVARVPKVDPNAPSPVIVAPVAHPPAEPTSPAATARPASSPPVQSTARVQPPPVPPPAAPTTTPQAKPVAKAPPPAAEPVAAAVAAAVTPKSPANSPVSAIASPPAGSDPKIQAFVDSVRVAGIRSSGADSKVLMNDHVYRIDDIVEPTLGVKLVKVAPDSISFSDPSGIVYKKYF